MRAVTACRNCGVTLRSTTVKGRPKSVCQSCQTIANRNRMRAYRQGTTRTRRGLVTRVSAMITAWDAHRRGTADATLNRGTAKRRCQSCYRLYHLTALEAPCPDCGNHLIDHPVTFEVSNAA